VGPSCTWKEAFHPQLTDDATRGFIFIPSLLTKLKKVFVAERPVSRREIDNTPSHVTLCCERIELQAFGKH
jgi:hypothetical protein